MEKFKSLVIILAAGQSQRMGYPKGLFLWNNKSLLKTHCETLNTLELEFCIVVNPQNIADYQREVAGPFLINQEAHCGPFSSVCLGVNHGLTRHAESFYILPIDTLPLALKTWQRLTAAIGEVVCPSYLKRSGHPVKLSKIVAHELLLSSTTPARLDHFLKQQKKTFVEVEDPHILSNQNSSAIIS